MDNREDVGQYYPGGSVVPAKPEPAAHPVESVNGKAGAVVLTAADVGALPDTTEIPDAEKVSAWGFLKKAWSDLVAAFAAKVHRHTIGQVDGLQSELSTLDQKATEASDLAASAQGTADSAAQQVSGAYAAANAAELKAGNAFTTAIAADSKASTAKLTAEKASGDVKELEERIDGVEGAAIAAQGTASEAKGAADAANAALDTKITNHGTNYEIRFADGPDGGNVVFNLRDGFVDRVLLASVGDGESIEFNWFEDGEVRWLFAKDIATKNAVATAQQTAEAATLSAGNAYTTAMAADSKATTADSKATAAKSIAEDAQASADDAVASAELAVRTAESKLDPDGTAANSAKLGGVDASEYARKTDVPKRVSNDTDTVRIDGEGNVYALEVPKSMYFIVDKGWGGGTDLQEWTLYSSGDGVWQWSNNGAYSSNSYYITYDASAGTLSAYYASGGYNRTITVEKNLDPTAEGVDFGGLGGLTVAQYSCSYVPKTNRRSEPSEPTDRFARESQVEEGLTPLAEGSLAGINDYLLNDCVIVSGVAVLSRDAVNRIDMSGVSSIALQYPTETGRVRDFVVVFDNVSGSPNIDFGTIEIVTDDASVLEVGAGTNVMSFTEISAGRFMVSRRVVEEVA